jgi:hypothetical protein
LLIAFCFAFAGYRTFFAPATAPTGARSQTQREAERPLPVTAVAAKKSDIVVYLNGLGTVTPINTVTVR